MEYILYSFFHPITYLHHKQTVWLKISENHSVTIETTYLFIWLSVFHLILGLKIMLFLPIFYNLYCLIVFIYKFVRKLANWIFNLDGPNFRCSRSHNSRQNILWQHSGTNPILKFDLPATNLSFLSNNFPKEVPCQRQKW